MARSNVSLPEIELVLMRRDDLERVAAGEARRLGGMHAPKGAVPPPHVVQRTLTELEAGTPPHWCAPHLMVDKARNRVLGACGFKWAPICGRAEIGYGVAASERCRGIATAGVGKLLELAAASGEASHVVATIVPSNIASTRVVTRLGFKMGHVFVGTDSETLVYWSYAITR